MGQGSRTKVEATKAASRRLRGDIRESLDDGGEDFGAADVQILKFHGIYQQDDRDQRQLLKADGLPKKYSFMIRTKNPGGGALTPRQWQALDSVADACGDGGLRITSRADIQYHGVGKKALKRAIQLLNSGLVSTYGACGDGNRNTTACPIANIQMGSLCDAQRYAQLISHHLRFRSNAYYEVWLDGERIPAALEAEPLYGTAYLPRKFKIGIAAHDENCIDVFTNDIGIIPVGEQGRLEGFTLLVGGGMGSTHKKAQTFPRLAEPIGFATSANLLEVITRIVEFQRDNGNRRNRSQARLKYLVASWGIERLKADIDRRLGWPLPPPKSFTFERSDLHLGWHEEKQNGLWFLGIPIDNGRIKDTADRKLKTGLKEVIRRFQPCVRLTTSQNIILSGLAEASMEPVSRCLADFGIPAAGEVSQLRRSAMACPALPTCGLAMAEAERFLPGILDDLEQRGYGGEMVTLRMSGCPNSCPRSPTAEIGIIGRSHHTYNIYLGGTAEGTRLARLYAESIDADDLSRHLASLLDVYRSKRQQGERFGHFVNRIGLEEMRQRVSQKNAPRERREVASL